MVKVLNAKQVERQRQPTVYQKWQWYHWNWPMDRIQEIQRYLCFHHAPESNDAADAVPTIFCRASQWNQIALFMRFELFLLFFPINQLILFIKRVFFRFDVDNRSINHNMLAVKWSCWIRNWWKSKSIHGANVIAGKKKAIARNSNDTTDRNACASASTSKTRTNA